MTVRLFTLWTKTRPLESCALKNQRIKYRFLVTFFNEGINCFPRLEEIQTENMKLKVENQKLSRRIETIRTDNQTILDLEGVGRSFFYT